MNKKWTREIILDTITTFVREQGVVPTYLDFEARAHGLPSRSTVEIYFARWQQAIHMAGFIPPPPKPRTRPNDHVRRSISTTFARLRSTH